MNTATAESLNLQVNAIIEEQDLTSVMVVFIVGKFRECYIEAHRLMDKYPITEFNTHVIDRKHLDVTRDRWQFTVQINIEPKPFVKPT